ncbi:SPW repeat domain-containing protein [Hyalangium sp.]|uniref:SPW repeat domain-containing protein n=1 Tax=Hyalangium sp. TaxID=2028555 RepID=UPI002D52099A|nr:SPW repeat protein [Hyalangium sp.]HYH98070.1 SPW repeat protein [Hyalangium sp.]
MWARWLNFFLGVWLFVAPLVFNYAERAARLNEAIVGMAVAIVALLGASIPRLSFINVALGGWLLLAPNVLGYGDSALPTAHNIVLGALIICAALAPSAAPTVRGLRRLVKT